MNNNFQLRKDDMPSEMQSLLREYPRDTWTEHPGFRDKTRQWMAAHRMFRQLSRTVREDTEKFLNKDISDEDYRARISYRGNILVGNLHGHHGWEDHSYFPELSAADSRFDIGLEILENDHENLDIVLDNFTTSANRTIKLLQLSDRLAYDEAGILLDNAKTIEKFLTRHLSDEEELAVPIILHHRLRG